MCNPYTITRDYFIFLSFSFFFFFAEIKSTTGFFMRLRIYQKQRVPWHTIHEEIILFFIEIKFIVGLFIELKIYQKQRVYTLTHFAVEILCRLSVNRWSRNT